MFAISRKKPLSAALRRVLRPVAALAVALPLATCAVPSSSAGSGKGSLSVSVPSVAAWISRPAAVSKNGAAARAYAFANSMKVEILSSSGVDVVDPVTSSVATSVVGGNILVSVPYVPSGSGYTVKVSVFNAAVSASVPVVSGSATGVAVTDGNTTQVSVVCLPLSSTALNLGEAANFTLAAKAETWYSLSAVAGQAYAFTLGQDSGASFVMGLFGGDGTFVASSQTSIVYRPSAAETLYLGVAGYSNTAAASGTVTAAQSDVTVATVGTIGPESMAKTGATSYPSDYKELLQALLSIQASDTVINDLSSTFKSSDFALATKIKDLGTKIETDAKNSLSSKTFTENADLSGSDVGSFFTLTAAQASCDAVGITSDGGAIAVDSNGMPTNLLGVTGSVQGNLQIDSRTLPSDSGIKYLCCKAKVAGNASVSVTRDYNGSVEPSTLNYNVAADYVCALSFVNPSGVGGKAIVKASASDVKTILDLISFGQSSQSYYQLIPSAIAVTVTVYDDSNAQVFTKGWTDSATLVADLSSLFGSLSVTIK